MNISSIPELGVKQRVSREYRHSYKLFDDLIFHNTNDRTRCLQYAQNRRDNCILFHGPYGTGKSAAAKILVNEREQGVGYQGVQIIPATSLDKESISKIRMDFNFQRSCLGVRMPVAIIDEIDHAPRAIQYDLRWEIDERPEFGCFIFTTNRLDIVEAGLRDRSMKIEMPSANMNQWRGRARWILDQEGVTISDTKLDELLATNDGSIRDLLRMLEDLVMSQLKLVA
jgi:DNA polymerase III delta prime subunit